MYKQGDECTFRQDDREYDLLKAFAKLYKVSPVFIK